MIAWLIAAAWAQEPVCATPYSRIQFGAAIGQITDALSDEDINDARERLNVVGERLPCLEEVIDHRLFAKFARYMSIAYFYAQDEVGALRWGLSSRIADPELQWSSDFLVGHPLRELVDDAANPMQGTIGGQGLNPPKGGGVFMNGSWAADPAAYAELPYLVQVFDRDESRIDAYWQDGSAFREELLNKPRELEPPTWWDGPGHALVLTGNTLTRAPDPPPPTKAPRTKPVRSGDANVPVVPIVASSALLITSGVTYFLAGNVAGTMADQTTASDLTATRSQANLLVMASGASLAGAVGFGIGGVFVHGNGITIRF